MRRLDPRRWHSSGTRDELAWYAASANGLPPPNWVSYLTHSNRVCFCDGNAATDSHTDGDPDVLTANTCAGYADRNPSEHRLGDSHTHGHHYGNRIACPHANRVTASISESIPCVYRNSRRGSFRNRHNAGPNCNDPDHGLANSRGDTIARGQPATSSHANE